MPLEEIFLADLKAVLKDMADSLRILSKRSNVIGQNGEGKFEYK